MGRQQSSEDADGGFKHLWPRIHVERHRLYNILDCGIKPLDIAHHYESVESVYKRYGVISCNVVGCPFVTADPMNNLVLAVGDVLLRV